MKRVLSRLLVVAAGLLVAASVQAQTTSANFQVQASVAASCAIVASPNLVFATAYDPAGANFTAALNDPTPANMSVRCTKGAIYTVTVGNGGNWTGTTRQMASGAERLGYGLFSDAGFTTPWTTSAAVTSTSRAAVTYPVYGSIPGGQDVAVGAYADTVALTINW